MKVLYTIFSFFILSTLNAQQKPNVVFILVDDLGYHDLGYTGSSLYETPNIDALSSKSFNFINGYAASRVCSPSRAAIMTGKSPARVHITDWIGAKAGTDWRSTNREDKLLPAEYLHQLPAEEITLAEAFKESGYKTFFAGKWHLGSEGSHPENHGFDINVGGYHAGSPIGGYFSPYNNPQMKDGENGENLSIRLASETAKFISSNTHQPFFAFLSFYAVHGPIQTTEEKWNKYQNKIKAEGFDKEGFEMERVLPIRKKQDNPVYAGLVETMDDAVGIVLNKLKELGLDKNTIVVFTSDNGGVASGDSYSTSNVPLRGGKGYQWEGGIKEPFLIYVPNKTPKKINTPVVGMDFYPTLLSLTGIAEKPNQHKDGLSLKPLMDGADFRTRNLFWHYPHYGNQGGEPTSIIRDGDWKLIHYWEDEHKELYNLKKDPSEQVDLASKRVKLVNEMNEKLMTWLDKSKAQKPSRDPNFDLLKRQKVLDKYENEYWPKLEKERQEMLKNDYQPNADWWGSQAVND